jgi:hypothetical protein
LVAGRHSRTQRFRIPDSQAMLVMVQACYHPLDNSGFAWPTSEYHYPLFLEGCRRRCLCILDRSVTGVIQTHI